MCILPTRGKGVKSGQGDHAVVASYYSEKKTQGHKTQPDPRTASVFKKCGPTACRGEKKKGEKKKKKKKK